MKLSRLIKSSFYSFTLITLLACSSQETEVNREEIIKEVSSKVKDRVIKKLTDSIRYHLSSKIEKQVASKIKNQRLLSNFAYQQVLKQNPSLKNFREKLYSDTTWGKKEIVDYLLNKYPMIIAGNEGKMSHHHPFSIDSSYLGLFNQKNWKVMGLYTGFYKLNFLDFQYCKIHEYDNLRYAWWNPYVENYNDPRAFREINKGFIEHSSVQESAYVLLINEFKVNFSRNPEDLWNYYLLYKEAVFEQITLDLYKKLKVDFTVNTLLDALEYYQKKTPEPFIEKLQIQYFGEKELNESQGNKQKFRYGSRRIENTQKNWHWYYSFWERRDVEGNTEMVLKILKDIQSHYEGISSLEK